MTVAEVVVAVAVASCGPTETLPLLPLSSRLGCQHFLVVFGTRSGCLEHRQGCCWDPADAPAGWSGCGGTPRWHLPAAWHRGRMLCKVLPH